MPSHDETSAVALQAVAAVNMDRLSYEAYFKKIAELANQLRANWRQEQRVKTLKVAIQLAKLLADSNQARLYAKKHRTITESLDEFGRLVYERVHSIARQRPGPGQIQKGASRDGFESLEEFAHHQLETAKEVSRNWFLKVASIRELVPRFYVELAILAAVDIMFVGCSPPVTPKSGAPVAEQFLVRSLMRLSRTAWGFGDAVVALHARLYLCQVASRLLDRRRSSSLEPSELPAGDVLLVNLNHCATLVRRLDSDLFADGAASLTISSGQLTTQNDNLGFELISSPIGTILNLMTVRYDDMEDSHPAKTLLGQQLQQCFGVLLENLAQGELENFALKRNAVLSAISRALPVKLAFMRGERLMFELRVGYDKWKHDKRGQQDKTTARDTRLACIELEELSKAERLEQVTISSFHTTLARLMIALDGCEQVQETEDLESEVDAAADSGPSALLSGAELILEELVTGQSKASQAAYLKCFKAVLTYANHYVDEAAVDRLLSRYLARVKPQRCSRSDLISLQHQAGNLLDIIKTLFTSKTNLAEFERILTLASFRQLLECLRRDEHKLDASRWILESMRAYMRLNRASCGGIRSRTMANLLLKLFQTINETVSPLADQDEIEQLGQIVVFYLDLITLDDIQERLEFYLRCRVCAGNLQPVLEYLIRRSLELPEAFRLVERKRNPRQNFLNGCLAFAFTTIPALPDKNLSVKLELYGGGCKLALERSSLSLADYYLKQILSTLMARESVTGADRTRTSVGVVSERQLEQLLNLVVEHQDNIDLKHKLALAEVLRDFYGDCGGLMQNLKNLHCLEQLERDDN